MSTLENTYCKNTEDNLRRYKSTGWTHIDKLDEGEDFIVARMCLGREVCHTVSKDSELLNHFRLIEDASPDACYGIVGIKETYSGESFSNVIVPWNGDVLKLDTLSVDNNFNFPIGITTGSYENVNDHEKQYGESKIISILEHILSLQVHLTGGSYIKVDDMVKELNKFNFYPNPIGKRIDGL